MAEVAQIMSDLNGIGIASHDAVVIVDCIVTRKSCSWVNTDPVDDRTMSQLNNLIAMKNYGIRVLVESIPTRSKYVWDVKVLQ